MAYSKKWYTKNKESINKKNREWYYKNKEKVITRIKKWRDENPEIDKDRKKKYRDNNKEKVAILTRSYIHKRKEEIKDFLGGICKRCGFTDKRALQFHHRTPKTKKRRLDFLTKGYDLSKIELICANCHCIEHDMFHKTNTKKYG